MNVSLRDAVYHHMDITLFHASWKACSAVIQGVTNTVIKETAAATAFIMPSTTQMCIHHGMLLSEHGLLEHCFLVT